MGRAAHRGVDGEGARGSCRPVGEPTDGLTASEEARHDPTSSGRSSTAGSSRPRSRGSIGINPFDQPNVQEAKDRTNEVLERRRSRRRERGRAARRRRASATTSASRRSSSPTEEASSSRSPTGRGETGCVVTHGLGPRYLHSTGQLHKGGPPSGVFLQLVDDTGEELAIPDRASASAAHPGAGRRRLRLLEERGLRFVRVKMEEVIA